MQVLIEFRGTSSLEMNNGRGIDPEDPLSRLINEIHSKKPRTDADNAEIARLEWQRASTTTTNSAHTSPRLTCGADAKCGLPTTRAAEIDRTWPGFHNRSCAVDYPGPGNR